jgi:uncharacterized protein (TIGR02996 family)
MSDEAALLAAITANPDEDTPRLAYADWLDEHRPGPVLRRGRGRKPTQNPRAELIRTQIELARFSDYDTSPETNALRDRCDEILEAHSYEWCGEFASDTLHWELKPDYRRGFPEHLRTPACWFLEQGEAIRRVFPTVTTLSVYRLNGWGERLAKSKHLRGLRELRVPCWCDAADLVALANSPNLKKLERLTLWVGGWGTRVASMGWAFARSRELPRLKQITLVWDPPKRVAVLVNREAGRSLAVSVNPHDRTFPFASDFDHTFFAGKLPDGRQVLAACPWAGKTLIPVLIFDAAGNQLEQRSVRIPAKDVLKDMGRKESPVAFAARRDATFQEYRELVCKRLGAEQADIRVREFDLEGAGIENMSNEVAELMYGADDPDEDFDASPYGPRDGAELGIGGMVEPWLGDHGMFAFTPGEGANPYYIGGRGRIVGHS